MAQKKVLIITYYWPPGGGAGVQRWLKFTKYLPAFGWSPVIYTPLNGEMPVNDPSLEADVPAGIEIIRRPIWEPYSLYKKFIGAGSEDKINTGFLSEKEKPGIAEKISVWLRGNLFIPDARCFWIKPSVKYLLSYLQKHPVDAIVSTGPPHSMHLIALQIARKTGIPWLADFRDPWTNIDYYKDLMLTGSSDRKHHRLEKSVVTGANSVVVIGKTMQQEFEKISGRKVEVITNGYDTDDIPDLNTPRPAKFTLSHIGTLVKTRNPEALWNALAALVKQNPEFAAALEVNLTGKVDISVRNAVKAAGLESYTVYTEYVHHNRIAAAQQRAVILLLVLNNTPNARGILTGKLFEYIAARRQILCIGPTDGDAAGLLNETGSGHCFNFTDEKGISAYLNECFFNWKAGKSTSPSGAIEQYSRKELTGKLAAVLESIAK
ncbi:MAG TPA: glycosyltransferase [Bacteroidia bacterium]|nr:glycosyltransferase [Bacteroidia bacterium]